MKVIARNNFEGWVNFGTINQSYQKTIEISVDKAGKVWEVSKGKKSILKSDDDFRVNKSGKLLPLPATESEAIKKYSEWSQYDPNWELV
jgi:hypothetical protein